MRLRESPEVLRSISLDLIDLDIEIVDRILEKLQLPLKYGMQLEEVKQILGESIDKQVFVKDRITYEFIIGELEKYSVSTTIHLQEGLIYLVVMTKDN